jgi:hypothetical protein
MHSLPSFDGTHPRIAQFDFSSIGEAETNTQRASSEVKKAAISPSDMCLCGLLAKKGS